MKKLILIKKIIEDGEEVCERKASISRINSQKIRFEPNH